MFLTPFISLTWAYQLHYYLCFRTHRRRPYLSDSCEHLTNVFNEICALHNYHLLEVCPEPAQVLCLLSLQPSQTVAKAAQILKTNASREITIAKPVWARGYRANSVGRMRIAAVRQYLENQSEHHGYHTRLLPPVYRYRTREPITLATAHSCFDLSHHLVLSTRKRKGVFDSHLGERLSEYWLRVATARRFAIDQLSVLPEHVHLIVRIVPNMSIEECALLLMNNGQHFVGKNYPQVLVDAGLDQLWESSAYAGTCGDFTTAFTKAWLKSRMKKPPTDVGGI
ncbi:MAG TPA: IS200/IS605 family transposase [Pyrinomonadaceae bacterium]|nr:IS200/IS605 family transposase [Pyrinomonadaceae bacterium]